MPRKENATSEIHSKRGTWKIVFRITNLWFVRKAGVKCAVEMVLMDQTGSKIGATLSEDYFAEFRHLLQHGKTYVLENFSVVRSTREWRVSKSDYMLYFGKPTRVTEEECLEIPENVYNFTSFEDVIVGEAKLDTLVDIIDVVVNIIEQHTQSPPYRICLPYRLDLSKPYHTVEVTQGDAHSQSLFSQGSQGSPLGRFLHNAKVVRLGEIKPLTQDLYYLTVGTVDEILVKDPWSYDSYLYCTYFVEAKVFLATYCPNQEGMKNMNSFPTCVDELIGKQLALRLKYRLQYRQCSVVDVSENEDIITAIKAKLSPSQNVCIVLTNTKYSPVGFLFNVIL
ncbi:Replication protein A DNA-binding subunit B [Glycine max]|nr:Replication protein A DNA-binding subunit B [Glycine max]